MSDALLTAGATVQCQHTGSASPTRPQPRVKLGGQPVVTVSSPYVVSGCKHDPPCVSAQYVTAAARVKSGGQPLLLRGSQAICTPNGTGLRVVSDQQRVKGQ